MKKPISPTYKLLVDYGIDEEFLLMAVQYELVTGNRFQFRHDNEAVFSMIEHALMIDDDKELNELTLEFIRVMPAMFKRQFDARGINTSYAMSRFRSRLVSTATADDNFATDHPYKEKANRFWRMLHLRDAV